MPSNKKNKPLDDIDDDDVPLRTDHGDDDEEEWEDFDDDEEEWIDDLDDDDDEEFDSDDEVPGGSSRTKFPKNNKPETDLYAVLGLTKQATQEEIAKSYRRQALKFHPDRNPEGAETFKKLTAAYEVLSDANARKRYDRTGQVGDGAGDVDIDEVSRSREIQDMLEHFMNAFRYSEDEVEELKKAFVEGRGLLEATLDNFPWTNDEGELERIVELVNTHIIDNKNTNGDDTATRSSKDAGDAIVSIDEKFKATWKKSATPSKVQSLSKKLDKERKEAEAILAEILAARHGDDNNNNNDKKKNKNKKNPMMITAGKNTSGSASSSASTSARQPKNAAASSSSTAVAKGSSSSTQLMLPSLASLRENAKKSFFDNIADLEAKYGGTKNGGGGGSSNKKAKKETKRK